MDRPSLRIRGLGWLAGALLAACSSAPPAPAPAPILEPPVMDLSDLGTLGMVDFGALGNADLAVVARREFLASLQSGQPGTPVLELGDAGSVLAGVGRTGFDPETVRAIGAKYHVDALVVGELTTDAIQPRMYIEARSFEASTELGGALTARILETKRGATIWTGNAQSRVSVGNVRVSAWGVRSIDAGQLDQARRALVRDLVEQATTDFHPHWVRPQ